MITCIIDFQKNVLVTYSLGRCWAFVWKVWSIPWVRKIICSAFPTRDISSFGSSQWSAGRSSEFPSSKSLFSTWVQTQYFYSTKSDPHTSGALQVNRPIMFQRYVRSVNLRYKSSQRRDSKHYVDSHTSTQCLFTVLKNMGFFPLKCTGQRNVHRLCKEELRDCKRFRGIMSYRRSGIRSIQTCVCHAVCNSTPVQFNLLSSPRRVVGDLFEHTCHGYPPYRVKTLNTIC